MNDYTLRYLPLFYYDLDEVISYISKVLKNPQAAEKLIDAVEEAILKRLPFAQSFEPYHSIREREFLYYYIRVHNFNIYYVVLEDENGNKIMEIRRLLYNGRNSEKLI